MNNRFTLPQAPRRSLVDSTIELIRGQIEGGAWKVGERIPREQELAEMLEVGRNTVREAIRVLSHGQVLEVRQGDGTYVRTNIDPAEVMRRVGRSGLREHFALRCMLETEAARLAAIGDVSAISTALSIAGGDARVSLRDSGTQVIAEVRDNVPLLPLMELSARAVAAKEPHGAEDGVTQPGVTQFGAMPEGRGHHDALVG